MGYILSLDRRCKMKQVANGGMLERLGFDYIASSLLLVTAVSFELF